MYNSLSVAKTLYDMYYADHGSNMDELRMHKLMYFTQRESLLQYKTPLFDEPFYGWKYGPVLHSVRKEYKKEHPFADAQEVTDSAVKKLLSSVYYRYRDVSSWRLSTMTHLELSWRFARNGMNYNENGDRQLSLGLMQTDANREKAARLAGRAEGNNGY